MQELVVNMGLSGSGKTTYAKSLSNYEYIDFDSLWNYSSPNLKDFISKLKEIMKEDKVYILDGFVIEYFEEFKLLMNNCKIDAFITFAPMWVILDRQKQKLNKPDNFHSGFTIMKNLSEIIDCKFVYTMDNEFIVYDKVEYYNMWEIINNEINEEEIEVFFESIMPNLEYDKYYQNIETDFNDMQGYTKSHESWKRIENVVNFKDKTVLDLGCFHGYFSFKAKENRAKSVLGVDIREDVLNTTKIIRDIKRTNCSFEVCDLNKDFPKVNEKIDIIICLNLLQHIENKELLLNNIFKCGKELIFEVNISDIDLINKFVERFGKNVQVIDSHRDGRKILVIK